MKRRVLRIAFGWLAFLAIAIVNGETAHAQPAQWNYTAPVGSPSLATYPGDTTVLGLSTFNNLTVTGICTGCGGGGGGVQLNVPNTWIATQTFNGAAATLGLVSKNMGETTTVVGAAPGSAISYDVLTQSILLYTTNAANNWTLNIRGSSGATLNSVLGVGQTITLAMITNQGGTAFYNTAVLIDGVSVTPKWQGGAPVAGNVSGQDVYTYTVIKTASATYTVLASQVQFR